MDSALPLAFGAGLLAVINPCALGMIPAYLALRTAGGAESRSLSLSVLGLVVGFVGVFSIVGVLVAAFGHALLAAVPLVAGLIGATLVGLGITTLAGRPFHLALGFGRIHGGAGQFVAQTAFGATYGLASLGCALPVFLAFAAIALTNRGLASLIVTLSAFSAGAALMLLALVLIGAARPTAGRGLRLTRILERYGGGALLIVAGLYILYLQLGFLIGYPFGIPVVTLPL